jgi:hypothetical protein
MSYTPRPPPGSIDLESLAMYLQFELERMARSLDETTVLELRESFAEPIRPRRGMLVYADGTHWDPGSGEGVYVYSSIGWKKMVVV